MSLLLILELSSTHSTTNIRRPSAARRQQGRGDGETAAIIAAQREYVAGIKAAVGGSLSSRAIFDKVAIASRNHEIVQSHRH